MVRNTMSERSKRLLAAATLVVCFALMTSVFRPQTAPARSPAPRRPASPADNAPARPADRHAHLRSLGELCGGGYIVRIYAGDEEPLYSIFDRNEVELATLMTAAEIEQSFDDPAVLDLIAGRSLLIADEPDRGW